MKRMLLGSLRCDEHDDAQVVAVCYGLYLCEIVIEGQVGDDESGDTSLGSILTKLLDAIVQDGVEIAHEDKRNAYLLFDVFELLQKQVYAHAVFQSLSGCGLDDGTVG